MGISKGISILPADGEARCSLCKNACSGTVQQSVQKLHYEKRARREVVFFVLH